MLDRLKSVILGNPEKPIFLLTIYDSPLTDKVETPRQNRLRERAGQSQSERLCELIKTSGTDLRNSFLAFLCVLGELCVKQIRSNAKTQRSQRKSETEANDGPPDQASSLPQARTK